MSSDPNWAYNPLPDYTMGPLVAPTAEAQDDLKSKYASACSSYTHVAEELEKYRQQEESMISTLQLFQGERERLDNELAWVMREAIPRMVVRVLQSEEFDREMLKIQGVMIELGRQLGRQEAQGLTLSMSNDGGHENLDTTMMEEISRVVSGLKKEKWAVMDDIIKAPELSYGLFRYVLRHGEGGEGPSQVA
ncbi:hypothetical protein CTI12_AA168350 [Artemisia annua]|uniref:Uncharacterized protein n=1 Tax=Artemisia annua TaxID=35608 RepID=A0A2U1PCN9_ARTAN|nr:hypothetical protein CTI12_AA168350 [Artemisia annua]